MTPRVAIVGSGMAGLTLAHRLKGCADTTVYEKSRGCGGRMATRYADPWRFDHGAQFFTVRDERFRRFIAPLVADGTLAEWSARFVEYSGQAITARRQWDAEYPHFVGVPGMNAIGDALATDLDVRLQTRVTAVERTADGWALHGDGVALGNFDWLVVTAPYAQTAALLPASVGAELPAATMRGCYSLMLGFDHPPALDWDAALVKNADISWISVNSSKPGRTAAPTLLVHATNRWADAHIEDPLPEVEAHLLAETRRVTALELAPAHVAVHRWRYANIDRQRGPTFSLFADERVGVCGDWFIRGRIEAASLSAMDLADALNGVIND